MADAVPVSVSCRLVHWASRGLWLAYADAPSFIIRDKRSRAECIEAMRNAVDRHCRGTHNHPVAEQRKLLRLRPSVWGRVRVWLLTWLADVETVKVSSHWWQFDPEGGLSVVDGHTIGDFDRLPKPDGANLMT